DAGQVAKMLKLPLTILRFQERLSRLGNLMSSIQIRDQMGMTMTHSSLAEVKWGTIDFGAYPDRLDSQAGDRTPCTAAIITLLDTAAIH
ncbi:hypothetical protein A2U01_0021570, partial [Trifolium medium]|nr:hypothetical protein [Trifolium medium]